MLRRFTNLILSSRLQAFMAAFILAFVPLLGSISILIAAFITLRKGMLEGLLIVCAATIPSLIAYFAYPTQGIAEEIAIVTIVVLVASNILTWLFAVVLRHYSNWSFVLEIAALIGVITIAAIHLIYPDIQSWWQTQLSVYVDKTAALLNATNDTNVAVTHADIITIMKRYATGFVTASVLFNALVQVLVARWWQGLMFNPGGLRKELYQIRLSYIAGVVFILGLALFYWGNEVVSDIMPVLILVFGAAGLSLAHCLAAPMTFGWLWLLLVYVALIGLFPVGIVCISLVALLDTVVNIRQRFNRRLY